MKWPFRRDNAAPPPAEEPQAPAGEREPLQPASVLHAYEVTPADAALMRMMAGAHFAPNATVGLPSGKIITGAEMARWIKAQGEQ